MFVAILVIAGMLSLFVRQRQREIGLLRAMGATPRQVRRMISRETLIVTALGAAVGVWPGLVLASHLACGMQARGLLPGTLPHRARHLVPVAAAVGAALVVALGRILRRGATRGPDPAHRGPGRGGRPDPVHRLVRTVDRASRRPSVPACSCRSPHR